MLQYLQRLNIMIISLILSCFCGCKTNRHTSDSEGDSLQVDKFASVGKSRTELIEQLCIAKIPFSEDKANSYILFSKSLISNGLISSGKEYRITYQNDQIISVKSTVMHTGP